MRVAAELVSRGVELELAPTNFDAAGVRLLFIRDNNGNLIEIVTPASVPIRITDKNHGLFGFTIATAFASGQLKHTFGKIRMKKHFMVTGLISIYASLQNPEQSIGRSKSYSIPRRYERA